MQIRHTRVMLLFKAGIVFHGSIANSMKQSGQGEWETDFLANIDDLHGHFLWQLEDKNVFNVTVLLKKIRNRQHFFVSHKTGKLAKLGGMSQGLVDFSQIAI